MTVTGQLIQTENTVDKMLSIAKQAINDNKTFSIFTPMYSPDEIMDLYFMASDEETEEINECHSDYDVMILKPIINKIMNDNTIDETDKEIIIESINGNIDVNTWILLDTDNWVSDEIDSKLFKLENRGTYQLKEINILTSRKETRDIKSAFDSESIKSTDQRILKNNNITNFVDGMTLDVSDYFWIKNTKLMTHIE